MYSPLKSINREYTVIRIKSIGYVYPVACVLFSLDIFELSFVLFTDFCT